MTSSRTDLSSLATSASGGAFGAVAGSLAVGIVLLSPVTSSAIERSVSSKRSTSSHVLLPMPPAKDSTVPSDTLVEHDSQAAISELRRLSGLTWDQLARVFGVSRRSVHFWASGGTLNARNEELLYRTLSAVRTVDRGSATTNRAALVGVGADGQRPVDLLASGDHDRFVALLGKGSGRERPADRPSSDTMASRARRPPVDLVDARQDRPYPASGRLLDVEPIPIPPKS